MSSVSTDRNPGREPGRAVVTWLGGTRAGLVLMALIVGGGAGLGAAGFRWLIFAFTWLVTGHTQFGQQGHVASTHFEALGISFLLIAPIVGGLIYGPLIQRFAREARGHGVPEVMLAVAENGGRIRPPVAIVKAFASAICIGTGGSVGREGPIVQVGSAFASSLGQLVRMSENNLRIIVACGAAGGIAATFNAPLTGMFFGFEIVLREFSLEALFATILAAGTGDIVSRAFFGSAPFFAQVPHGLTVTNDTTYLLVILLGVFAGLIGYAFKVVLYKLEDAVDSLWSGRPEWARPAVGGVALGLLLLAIPQMYGVGYPVMDRVFAGHVVLGLILLFIVAKIAATSLTLSIGGSGGVFAPSLFTGAMAGTAFGIVARHLFGTSVGPAALYGVAGMGGVFAGAAQVPLTAIGSVVEMTGNFGLTVPIMLAAGVAAALSRRLSYGSIYTTKLLRKGIDIERVKPADLLGRTKVTEAMQAIPGLGGDGVRSRIGRREPDDPTATPRRPIDAAAWARRLGTLTDAGGAEALFEDETLEQALRQLALYGPLGLPVVSRDGNHVEGWMTRQALLRKLADSLDIAADDAALMASTLNPDQANDDGTLIPAVPLSGYRISDLTVGPDSSAIGSLIGELDHPPRVLVVGMLRGRNVVPIDESHELRAGDHLVLLVPEEASPNGGSRA